MRTLLTFLLAFSLAACGGSDTDSSSNEASSSRAATAQQAGDVDRTIEIQASGKNNMRYAQTEFEVAPGETVRLVFENTDTSPSMEHNVVVLDEPPSQDAFRRVGEAGMSAGSLNDYVPDDPAVLAYTAIASPGETVEVTFTAPEETGEYGYLCTFPGHWATMNGTMRVTDSPA